MRSKQVYYITKLKLIILSELGKGLKGIMACKQTSCTVCHFRIHYYSCTANKSTTSQN